MCNANCAKTMNIPLHLRGAERAHDGFAKNNAISLIDMVVARANANDRTASKYLKKQRVRTAIARLPDFEREMRDEIALLRADNMRLNRLMSVTNWILIIAIVIGAMIWML